MLAPRWDVAYHNDKGCRVVYHDCHVFLYWDGGGYVFEHQTGQMSDPTWLPKPWESVWIEDGS